MRYADLLTQDREDILEGKEPNREGDAEKIEMNKEAQEYYNTRQQFGRMSSMV
jgi:hypothetical protein